MENDKDQARILCRLSSSHPQRHFGKKVLSQLSYKRYALLYVIDVTVDYMSMGVICVHVCCINTDLQWKIVEYFL